MEYLINEDVILVTGAVNGAIYSFGDKKVYKVNKAGLNIICKYIDGQVTIKEEEYLRHLLKLKLLSESFIPRKHISRNMDNPPKIEMAWLEITEGCNLRCVHCYEGEIHKKFNDSISLSKWESTIDELIELGAKRLIIIGGEPCCCSFVKQIVSYCGKKGIDTTFFTNATLIDDELINIFKKYSIKVKISIYGGSAKVHDAVTSISGSFEKLENNIIKMNKLGVKMYASVILMKENQYELNNIISFVKKNKIVYSGYDVIRNVYGGGQSCHTPDRHDVINAKYRDKPNFTADKKRFEANHHCNSCWFGKIAIQENGNVLPCVFQRDILLGSIKEKTIKEIINDEPCKKCWYLSYDFIAACKECEYRYACKDCRVIGLAEKGNMFEKSPRCLYNPMTGIWEKNPG